MSNSRQEFVEACLADRGYRFVRKEGQEMVWQLNGLKNSTVARVDENGRVSYFEETVKDEDEPNDC